MVDQPLPEAILLDAHGTLLALDDPVGSLEAGLAEAGFPSARHAVAAAFAAEVDHYRRHQDLGRDGPSLRALRRACAAVLVAALPPPAPPVGLVAELLVTRLRPHLYPEVVSTLDAVRAAGCRLAVVSNWDCSLPTVLDALGIAERFDVIAPSATVGARKPDPAHFRFALDALGVVPGRAVHVGDDPAHDCVGAARAGIRPVLLDRTGAHAGAPWVRIPTLAGLLDLLGVG